jgi:23S rRNA-/tRNA-specific pseudouridylate synthase
MSVQIRVHLAEVLGMPIVGDYKYGWRALRAWPPPEDTKSALQGIKESGHVWASRPSLHLHCRQLTLPDVAAAFQSVSAALVVVAPLPPHMLVSWNMKPLPMT